MNIQKPCTKWKSRYQLLQKERKIQEYGKQVDKLEKLEEQKYLRKVEVALLPQVAHQSFSMVVLINW